MRNPPREGLAEHARPATSVRGELEFQRLLDKLPAAAYTCDAEGLITYFNPPAARLWGRSPSLHDPVDRFCGSFKLFAADGTPIAHDQCWMALALRQDREFNGEEILIERPDGRRVAAIAHANPIHDESGRMAGAVNMLLDISDQKRTERALREADRAKNEFLATLAHELRNPLAPIRNAAKILDLSGAASRDAQWAIDVIDRQLGHMSRLIDDLVDVARITNNRLELRRQPLQLGDAIQAAVEACMAQIESRGLELVIALAPASLVVNGDMTRLVQVFSNLLDNASRYTERGGRIWVEACREDGCAAIRIRDTGIGISSERLGAIFEIFAPGDGPPPHVPSGLGVGLTLARRLVELHGGSIRARSDGPGRGSEFVVRLPLVPGAATRAAAEPGPTAQPEPDGTHRILVVDDNQDSAISLAMLLRARGHFIRTAFDGVQALEAADEFRPDVALLDIGLPGMNGYDLARAIRGRDWGTAALLVAITGWGQEMDRLRSRDAGFDHHMVKPVELPVLDDLIVGHGRYPVAPATAGEARAAS